MYAVSRFGEGKPGPHMHDVRGLPPAEQEPYPAHRRPPPELAPGGEREKAEEVRAPVATGESPLTTASRYFATRHFYPTRMVHALPIGLTSAGRGRMHPAPGSAGRVVSPTRVHGSMEAGRVRNLSRIRIGRPRPCGLHVPRAHPSPAPRVRVGSWWAGCKAQKAGKPVRVTAVTRMNEA